MKDSGLKRVHLSLHLPAGDGSLAVVAGFELQGDGARADVGDGHVGRGARELCEEAEREEPTSERQTTGPAVGSSHDTGRLLACLGKSILLSAPLWRYRYFFYSRKGILDLVKPLHAEHRRRQRHECQLHRSYLEIRFNLIPHCLHLR